MTKNNTTNREYSARAICWSFPLSSTTLRLETPRGGRTNPPPPVRPKVAKHRIRTRVNFSIAKTIEPDDAVSGESLFLFLAFIYQIYYITAMLVIIFAYIIHTIMAKSTIQHIKSRSSFGVRSKRLRSRGWRKHSVPLRSCSFPTWGKHSRSVRTLQMSGLGAFCHSAMIVGRTGRCVLLPGLFLTANATGISEIRKFLHSFLLSENSAHTC